MIWPGIAKPSRDSSSSMRTRWPSSASAASAGLPADEVSAWFIGRPEDVSPALHGREDVVLLDRPRSATVFQGTPDLFEPVFARTSAALNNFGITSGGHSAACNGDFSLSDSETSTTVATTRVVVGRQLAVRVVTPDFNDTITLLAGHQIDASCDAEAFARSGQIDAVGKNGSLQLTALPSGSVRIDLDANGDGQFEQTKTVTWDWIF